MRMISWLGVAALGLSGMSWAFSARARLDPSAPWASGMVLIGPRADEQGKSEAPLNRGRLEMLVNGYKSIPGREGYITVSSIATPSRMLPAGERGEAILKGLALTQAKLAASLEVKLRPRLISWPMDQSSIDPSRLKSGRLPAPESDEILAGPDTHAEGPIAIDDRSLTVVGVLKPDLALLANTYLVPRNEHSRALFPPDNPDVGQVILVAIPSDRLRARSLIERFKKDFPSPDWRRISTDERIPGTTYGLYLLGMAVFLLGGTGALREVYRWAARKVGWRALADPLLEIDRRPRLFWTVHLVYFGLMFLGSIAIRGLPEVQAVMLGAIEGAFEQKGNLLAMAGEAYASGSVPRAAGVTFVVNFFLGSLAMLTLPSLVFPGGGAFAGALRASLWGVLLAPSHATMAQGMIPHSGTLLLEGEAYILAIFFGLLIPIRVFRKSQGLGLVDRYRGAVALNFKANILVALVLGVAAWYEAIEVIAQIH